MKHGGFMRLGRAVLRVVLHAALLLATVLLPKVLTACSKPLKKGSGNDSAVASAAPSAASSSLSSSPAGASSVARSDAENKQREIEASVCARAMDEALKQTPAPGAAQLERVREEILARAKGRPVLFLQVPQRTPPSAEARSARRVFDKVSVSALSMYSAYRQLVPNVRVARELFLHQGYLYADSVQLAMGLANILKLEDLFDDPRLWLHRGGEVIEVQRHLESGERVYRYVSGPEEGQRATILFLDRAAQDPQQLETPLHRDFSGLQAQLGFDAVRIEHLAATKIVSQLRYGEIWVRSLLVHEKAGNLELECEVISSEDAAKIETTRGQNRRLWRVMGELRRTIGVQMVESLPFDEPKTEFGQEDGKLRQAWSWAYRFGRSHFEYNEDRYRVFDHLGRPRVPQVCIDFITDTLERASGTWYRNRGEPRERTRGRLDFNDFGIENRRSVESLVAFTEQHPEWFTVTHVPPRERFPFQRRGAFYDYLKANRAVFRVGNIVTILGLRDDDREHYHSFFVYDVDPITQMPIWLASNAGRPRIRVWENELSNAPKRSIKSVIQPELEWLAEKVLGEARSAENIPTNGR